jgi:hypothetical protein
MVNSAEMKDWFSQQEDSKNACQNSCMHPYLSNLQTDIMVVDMEIQGKLI